MARNRRSQPPGKMPGNMNQLMQQAQRMQVEMQQRRAELLTKTFSGTAGGGVVSAVVRGDGSLDRVTIDPSVLDDAEMVGDLVVAAVNQALDALNREAGEGLESLGGLDLGGMLG
jgi:DNA-binding YbaB/EbfC family protein